MKNNYEVLIIDDHIELAKAYSDLIEIKCQLSSVPVSSFEEAISYLTKHPIKILVIDQIMPVSGTEMFEQLKKINPYLKAIMVSGEATYQDTIEAKRLGYIDFLHKKDIKELPDRIFALYAEYESGFIQNKTIPVDKCIFVKKKYTLFKILKTEYILVDYKIIKDDFIFNNRWKTKETINKGQNKTTIIELQTMEKSIVTEEIAHKLKNSFEISDKLLFEINSALESSLSTSYKIEVEKEKKESHSETVTLKIEEETIEGKPVMSKSYEIAQVYTQILLHIKKICHSCGDYRTYPMVVYRPVEKLASRHVYYFADASRIEIDTGFLTW